MTLARPDCGWQPNQFGCSSNGKSPKRLLGLVLFIFQRFLVIETILCVSVSVCISQTPIDLRRADLLRTEQGAAGTIRYLDGNVWITQDTLSITGDHAIYDEAAGQLNFTGDVHFTEPSRQIWADQATYFERDGRADASGRVRIEQDSVAITCDRVVYHEARKEANFLGHVRIHSLRENAVLTGNLGTYSRQDQKGAMTQNPRLVRYFDADDSMVVVGSVIKYQFDTKSATVTDSVHLQRNDFDAWGQSLVYQDSSEWARLIGDPVLRRGRDLMQADTVDTYFENERVRRVVLFGKAQATSPADSLTAQPENSVTGRRMELVFKNNDLDSIHVRGNATSVYYLREKDGTRGANRVSGDAIDMWMQKGRVEWIYVEGGTEGAYFPQRLENLVESDERSGSKPGGRSVEDR